jgi:glucose/arabinose dehydrogenase
MPDRRHCLLLFAAALATPAVARSQPLVASEHYRLRVVTVADGLEHPWGLAFLPDGRMLVTERPGRLRIVGKGGLEPQPVAGLPKIVAAGQGGLLDVALHPRFADNALVYLAYVAGGEEGTMGTQVARARLAGNRLEDVQVIFRMRPKLRGVRHFGARLVFDRAGLLYVTLGDRGEQDLVQKLDSHIGTIVRITDDGRVPADNPFVKKAGIPPEVYSVGNRNVQGAAIDPRTGLLWAHEHGPQGGDELNVIRAGVNYGWPTITHGVNYGTGTKIGIGTAAPGLAQPIRHWSPAIAPSGMTFYTGDAFPSWRGDLFIGSLREQMLLRLRLDGEKVVREERLLRDAVGRIRDVRTGPDGLLYLLTDHRDGALLRLEPAGRP